MEQRQLAEAVRKILQAAGLDGWQVDPTSIPCSDHSPFEAAGQIQMHPTGKSSGRHMRAQLLASRPFPNALLRECCSRADHALGQQMA